MGTRLFTFVLSASQAENSTKANEQLQLSRESCNLKSIIQPILRAEARQNSQIYRLKKSIFFKVGKLMRQFSLRRIMGNSALTSEWRIRRVEEGLHLNGPRHHGVHLCRHTSFSLEVTNGAFRIAPERLR